MNTRDASKGATSAESSRALALQLDKAYARQVPAGIGTKPLSDVWNLYVKECMRAHARSLKTKEEPEIVYKRYQNFCVDKKLSAGA